VGRRANYGFEEVQTLDLSPYEGASHIHDLNDREPPPAFAGTYQMDAENGFEFGQGTAHLRYADGPTRSRPLYPGEG
jgi:hypothetical protein